MADVEVTYRGQIIRSMSASGTEVLHTGGKLCDDDITIDYTSPGGGGANLQTKSVSYTPSESAISDTILPDPGYDGMDEVDVSVAAIPDSYVGSGIPQRSSADLSVMGRTVTAPSGYYSLMAAAQVAQGTAGTPAASKGAVSNHSVDVTPSVTNTTGYITGSTINGTPVTVSASELVSGSQEITVNDTYDVTNLAEVVVNVSGGVPDFIYDDDAGSYTFAEDLNTNPANYYPMILGDAVWQDYSANKRRVYYLWSTDNTPQNTAFLCGCVIIATSTPPTCVTARQNTSNTTSWATGTGSAIGTKFTAGSTVHYAILKNPKIDTF